MNSDDYDYIHGVFSTHEKTLNEIIHLKEIGYNPKILEIELDESCSSPQLYKKLYFANKKSSK